LVLDRRFSHRVEFDTLFVSVPAVDAAFDIHAWGCNDQHRLLLLRVDERGLSVEVEVAEQVDLYDLLEDSSDHGFQSVGSDYKHQPGFYQILDPRLTHA